MKKSKRVARKAVTGNVSTFAPLQADIAGRSLWQDPFIHLLFIMVIGFAIYANSMNSPFVFDDYPFLVENPTIKSFACFPDTQKVFQYSILQDIKNNLVLRPVSYFTFALNYAIHGLNLFGYHLVNLLLHIGNAMLVYCLFFRLMLTPSITREGNPDKFSVAENVHYLPLFAALLFVCHPLQTQAVNYIIQRFVPLATFFYLAALVLYLEYRRITRPVPRSLAYILAVTAAILAMESKEIAFTLPIVIALVECMFFDGSRFSRFVRLVPFFATMAIIPVKLMQLPSSVTADKTETISDAINLVNVGGTSSWNYLMTQFGVITTYIRLMLLPVGLNLDYDYPLQQNFFTPEVLLPFVLLLMIVGTGIYLLKRSRENRFNLLIAFGIFWFFITLSVESSIVPIEDYIFEHRAYLPSVGLFISLLAGVAAAFNRLTGSFIVKSKTATILLMVLVLSLSATTIARNKVWQNEITLWSDVVEKSPKKFRGYSGLGEALIRQAYVSDDNIMLEGMLLMKADSDKNIGAAINAFKEAIRLKPKFVASHINLARALMLQKKFDEALRVLSVVSELQPNNASPYVMRGEIFEAKKDLYRARQEYLAANKVEPFSHLPHAKLADVYAKEGNIPSAIQELELVMRIRPDEVTRKKLDRLKKGVDGRV